MSAILFILGGMCFGAPIGHVLTVWDINRNADRRSATGDHEQV